MSIHEKVLTTNVELLSVYSSVLCTLTFGFKNLIDQFENNISYKIEVFSLSHRHFALKISCALLGAGFVVIPISQPINTSRRFKTLFLSSFIFSSFLINAVVRN